MGQTIGQPDSFIANVRKGNTEGLKVITIPSKLCDFLGLASGDSVKVWIKKVELKKEE